MFSFFGKTTRSIRAGNMGEDGPSILFLVQIILSSFFNLFMLIVGIMGWSKGGIYDRQNTFEAFNAMPSVYTYMTIWAIILFLILICAIKAGCSHPCYNDKQRIFYLIYLWVYTVLSPLGFVYFSITAIILFFVGIQDVIERGILYITNIKQTVKQKNANKPRSTESAMWNKYDQFLKDGDR